MTRIYANSKKIVTLDVVGQSVVLRTKGKSQTRTFRNRYTLRKFVSDCIEAASGAGFLRIA